jgi:hypothetical protein
MNIRTLQRGLAYRGRVKAVRQRCHVFEAQRKRRFSLRADV